MPLWKITNGFTQFRGHRSHMVLINQLFEWFTFILSKVTISNLTGWFRCLCISLSRYWRTKNGSILDKNIDHHVIVTEQFLKDPRESQIIEHAWRNRSVRRQSTNTEPLGGCDGHEIESVFAGVLHELVLFNGHKYHWATLNNVFNSLLIHKSNKIRMHTLNRSLKQPKLLRLWHLNPR